MDTRPRRGAESTGELSRLLAQSEWIATLARSLTRDPHAADDLAQETRMAALRHPLKSGQGGRKWLAAVARNASRLLYRKEITRRSTETSMLQEHRGAAPAPEELLAQAEIREALSRLVRELPEQLSDVILLSFFEGLSSNQIANLRNLPANTVRSRKKRALELLRERLDGLHDGIRSAWLSALSPMSLATGKSGTHGVAISALPTNSLTRWTVMSLSAKYSALALLVLCTSLTIITEWTESVEGSLKPQPYPNASTNSTTDPLRQFPELVLGQTPARVDANPEDHHESKGESAKKEVLATSVGLASRLALAINLHELSARMTSDTPPLLVEVEDVLRQLAIGMEVDPSSIVRSLDGVETQAKYSLAGTDIAAEVTLRDSRASLFFRLPPAASGDSMYLFESLSVSIKLDEGGATDGSTQFHHHPDSRLPSSRFLESGATGICGWTYSNDERQPILSPTEMMAADDGIAWHIGRIGNIDSKLSQGGVNLGPYHAWAHLLRTDL